MRRAFARFWSEDRGLTLLLVLLVLVILAGGPLSRLGLLGETVLGALFTAMLVSGVAAVSGRHWVGRTVLSVAVVAIGMEWASHWSPTPGVRAAAALGEFGCVLILATLVFQKVLGAGSITMHRIIGSVAGYLLLGIAWGELYRFLSIVLPGSLSTSGGAALETRAQHFYFSIVTLTTVGYGDIVPLHPLTRSLATLEALTGQLFPAILIARLVSLEIMARGGRR